MLKIMIFCIVVLGWSPQAMFMKKHSRGVRILCNSDGGGK